MKSPSFVLSSIVALSLVACAGESSDNVSSEGSSIADEAVNSATILEVAQGDETLSTLVASVTAAGLGETLSGEGPSTVFAPTNDAFAKIDEATLAELTTNDTETLGAILQYHVVEGAVDAGALIAAIEEAGEGGYTLTTIGGGTFTAAVVDGAVILTDASGNTSTITATNVEASNGLVHVIDTVLMPQ